MVISVIVLFLQYLCSVKDIKRLLHEAMRRRLAFIHNSKVNDISYYKSVGKVMIPFISNTFFGSLVTKLL